MTSHQMVALARRLFQQRRVGHAGTLDPLAEGVLPLMLGRATRLADRVSDDQKLYYAEVELGRTTTTDDLEGETLSERRVPALSQREVQGVLDRFVGVIQQRPPAFSAIKMGGVTSYKRARRGELVDMPLRTVHVESIELVRMAANRLDLLVHCGKGTYVRALARDIGEGLGCGGTVARLVRLRVGRFGLAEAVTPDELRSAVESGSVQDYVLEPDFACLDLPVVVLDEETASRAINGQSWVVSSAHGDAVRVYDRSGEFLGLARTESGAPDSDADSRLRLRLLIHGQ